MYKKCKVVLLPTKQEGNLYLWGYKLFTGIKRGDSESHHLYVLSDDEIKEGDWFINRQYMIEEDNVPEYALWRYDNQSIKPNSNPMKIIASTDSSLKIPKVFDYTKYGENLPSIPQSFIDYYVSEYNKGNKIEEVMVEYEPTGRMKSGGVETNITEILKLNSDNTINIKPIKDSFTRAEVIEKIYAVLRATGVTIRAEMTGIATNTAHLEFSGEDIDKWIKNNL
jgi:hypothetical protein